MADIYVITLTIKGDFVCMLATLVVVQLQKQRRNQMLKVAPLQ